MDRQLNLPASLKKNGGIGYGQVQYDYRSILGVFRLRARRSERLPRVIPHTGMRTLLRQIETVTYRCQPNKWWFQLHGNG
jgi:hypothetical protein